MEDVRQVFTCCEVWVKAPLGTPCWVCGDTKHSVEIATLPAFHPWTKIEHMYQVQTATRPYL